MDGSSCGDAGKDKAQAKWQKWWDGLTEEERTEHIKNRKLGDEALNAITRSLIGEINNFLKDDFISNFDLDKEK